VIRAFTYFSHLANLAEDRHHIRRRQVHERAGDTQEGSIEVALARLRWAGIHPRAVSQTLAHSYLSPVLTAHPTEVQRKSILDAERDLARLLTERDEIRARTLPRDALAPRELAANEAQMRARVLQLWQTRLLRFTKLTGGRRDRDLPQLLRRPPSCARSPSCTRSWRTNWATTRWATSCAWASGSAATATATPT
jgi:phosphoenolpyruvate carboxylase